VFRKDAVKMRSTVQWWGGDSGVWRGTSWCASVERYELCGISLNRRFDCWWLPVVIIVAHADYTAQSKRSDVFGVLVLCLRHNGLARLRASISSNIQPSPRPSAVDWLLSTSSKKLALIATKVIVGGDAVTGSFTLAWDHLCHDMDGVLEVGKYRVGMRGLWGWVRVIDYIK
jgi:hypothetical protein